MPPRTKLWPLEEHTKGKHLVLKAYLDAWIPKLGFWNGRMLFIDGFAGPGEYAGGEEGSPLIALRAFLNHPAKDRLKASIVFDFVEQDPARAAHLETLVEPLRTQLPASCSAEVVVGAFDETMTGLLDALEEQKKTLAPAFVMIDPFGVSDTPMEVIRRILRNDRCEVYVSFMYEAINRFKGTPEFEPHLDKLFGCTDWRQALEIEDAEQRKQFLYGLYESQLRKAGASSVVHFDLYDEGRLIYAIFFATQHWQGADAMKQAVWKPIPVGNFAFHGTRSRQLTLNIDQPNFDPLKKMLKERFAGKGWVSIQEIQEFVGSDQTDYHTQQLKGGALKPMEKVGEIEGDSTTRTKRFTYPDGVKLRFLK
jgi:three-Cys-motif partner protein